MKFRVSQWLDTNNLDVKESPIVYGIQVNRGDGSGWLHVAENGEQLFFQTPEAAVEKVDELEARYEARAND